MSPGSAVPGHGAARRANPWKVASFTRRIRGLVRGMDPATTDAVRTRLSGAQAALLLRIGEDAGGQDHGHEPDGAGHGNAQAQAPDSKPVAARGVPPTPAYGRTQGAITLAVLGVLGFSVALPAKSAQVVPVGGRTSGSVSAPTETAAIVAGGRGAGVGRSQESTMVSKMKNAAAVGVAGAAMIVGSAEAQAVQWKVEDGGNGHWYQLFNTPQAASAARSTALAIGGMLAVVRSENQTSFLVQQVLNANASSGAWIGGFQDRTSSQYSEPAGGWVWVDGTAISGYTNWDPTWSEPNNANTQEDWVEISNLGTWNDASQLLSRPFIVEWSSDCNSDGIVDYGQIRQGQLTDANANNTPDCCESGTPCLPVDSATQWRIDEGGNGHWYRIDVLGPLMTGETARAHARGLGAHLVSITTPEEGNVIKALAADPRFWGNTYLGPMIGLSRDSNSCNAGCWDSGEPLNYTNWHPGNPDPSLEPCVYLYIFGTCVWQDYSCDLPGWGSHAVAAVLEWSADCNSDGIVDYGQILTGQLADTNANGIPDLCEQPTCTDADLFRDFTVNGADLGILLSQWGPNTPLTVSDLNADGTVDGADLGLLLYFWGRCAP